MEEVLLPQVHHEFLLWEGCNKDAKSRLDYIRRLSLMRKVLMFTLNEEVKGVDKGCGKELSALIYCRDLDMITLRYLIKYEGKLILEDPQPGVPRVSIPRAPRASMQDLYDRMGRMEICQKAIERIEYSQSYH
nr:hypothetical protein [Tanacetum cinerariifolium]